MTTTLNDTDRHRLECWAVRLVSVWVSVEIVGLVMTRLSIYLSNYGETVADKEDRSKRTRTLTKRKVGEAQEREERHKENYGNYECPICRKYVWWDTPHEHRVGEKVRV